MRINARTMHQRSSPGGWRSLDLSHVLMLGEACTVLQTIRRQLSTATHTEKPLLAGSVRRGLRPNAVRLRTVFFIRNDSSLTKGESLIVNFDLIQRLKVTVTLVTVETLIRTSEFTTVQKLQLQYRQCQTHVMSMSLSLLSVAFLFC